MQNKIKDKYKILKELMVCTDEEDLLIKRDRYKEARRTSKMAVAEEK